MGLHQAEIAIGPDFSTIDLPDYRLEMAFLGVPVPDIAAVNPDDDRIGRRLMRRSSVFIGSEQDGSSAELSFSARRDPVQMTPNRRNIGPIYRQHVLQ